MGSDDESFFAAAAILKTLAVEPPPTDDDAEIPVKRVINGFDKKRVQLPGANTPGKKAFTTELECLMRRVHELETELVSHPTVCFAFRLCLAFHCIFSISSSTCQLIQAFVLAVQETPQIAKTQAQIR